ncbi:MAG: HEAT repeat domain-containing protein [Kiritimatiellae bacterium]|nr:HEAT repeat domain-containing protein [Kiritimatiellia bacterium]
MKWRIGIVFAFFAAFFAYGDEVVVPDYDALLYRALRYGNTEQRRAEKENAKKELFAQGADALRAVMERAHVENIMLQVLAFEIVVEHVPAETGTPVLADFLNAPDEQTRRIAAYLLGFYPRDDAEIPVLLAMLDKERERNVALRTLGKWRVDEARSAARDLLRVESERTRITACNALSDIGNVADLSALIEALGDSAFLVRNTAARAIERQGKSVRGLLAKALASSVGVQKRQIVRLLGVLEAAPRREMKRLERSDSNAGIREDADWALHHDAGPWIWEKPYY